VDNTTDTQASSKLVVSFTPTIDKGELDFGFTGAAISTIRDRELVQGADASIVVDSVTSTKSSNTITDLIEGATLNLVGEDSDTTITLKVERDLDSIKSKITDLASAYNTIMDYIATQFTYDEDT